MEDLNNLSFLKHTSRIVSKLENFFGIHMCVYTDMMFWDDVDHFFALIYFFILLKVRQPEQQEKKKHIKTLYF